MRAWKLKDKTVILHGLFKLHFIYINNKSFAELAASNGRVPTPTVLRKKLDTSL
jgi:hypothetical protein